MSIFRFPRGIVPPPPPADVEWIVRCACGVERFEVRPTNADSIVGHLLIDGRPVDSVETCPACTKPTETPEQREARMVADLQDREKKIQVLFACVFALVERLGNDVTITEDEVARFVPTAPHLHTTLKAEPSPNAYRLRVLKAMTPEQLSALRAQALALQAGHIGLLENFPQHPGFGRGRITGIKADA